jgi:hypothetical protein
MQTCQKAENFNEIFLMNNIKNLLVKEFILTVNCHIKITKKHNFLEV